MSVNIDQTVDHEMYVNNKYCYKDTNGNWIAKEELTPSEAKAFRQHVRSQ